MGVTLTRCDAVQAVVPLEFRLARTPILCGSSNGAFHAISSLKLPDTPAITGDTGAGDPPPDKVSPARI
jgi:hypothetical protein